MKHRNDAGPPLLDLPDETIVSGKIGVDEVVLVKPDTDDGLRGIDMLRKISFEIVESRPVRMIQPFVRHFHRLGNLCLFGMDKLVQIPEQIHEIQGASVLQITPDSLPRFRTIQDAVFTGKIERLIVAASGMDHDKGNGVPFFPSFGAGLEKGVEGRKRGLAAHKPDNDHMRGCRNQGERRYLLRRGELRGDAGRHLRLSTFTVIETHPA